MKSKNLYRQRVGINKQSAWIAEDKKEALDAFVLSGSSKKNCRFVVKAIINGYNRFIAKALSEGGRVSAEIGVFELRERRARTIKIKMPCGKTVITQHPVAFYPRLNASPALKNEIWKKIKPVYETKAKQPE